MHAYVLNENDKRDRKMIEHIDANPDTEYDLLRYNCSTQVENGLIAGGELQPLAEASKAPLGHDDPDQLQEAIEKGELNGGFKVKAGFPAAKTGRSPRRWSSSCSASPTAGPIHEARWARPGRRGPDGRDGRRPSLFPPARNTGPSAAPSSLVGVEGAAERPHGEEQRQPDQVVARQALVVGGRPLLGLEQDQVGRRRARRSTRSPPPGAAAGSAPGRRKAAPGRNRGRNRPPGRASLRGGAGRPGRGPGSSAGTAARAGICVVLKKPAKVNSGPRGFASQGRGSP